MSVTKASRNDTVRMAVEVVSSYVGNNKVTADGLTELIKLVVKSLDTTFGQPELVEKQKPAVSIKRSVTNDHIVCLEDGEKLKMLKRHLRTSHGMTPDDYRAKWNLGPNYPMVAPNYAEQRSAFAKKIGLGQKPKK